MKITKTILLAAALMAAVHVQAQKISRDEYIRCYKGTAVEHMEKYGIPASIKMAQGILESDSGNSRLAREANNHFGIKCKSDWAGETIEHDDDHKGECFRRYAEASDSWLDHSEFLDKGQRYQFLFDLDPTDYKAWAHGLRHAGYATNPRYPELLIKIIEECGLHCLDLGGDIADAGTPAREEVGKSPSPADRPASGQVDVDNYVISMFNHNGYEIYSNNGSKFIVAREGDDIAKISWLFGIPESRLRRFNDLTPAQDVTQGGIVYIQSKNRRSDGGHVIHTVAEGETLHSISQRYGIRMKPLARRNGYDPSAALFAGQQIRL